MFYDVIVIGAGAAGLNIATPAAKLGLKTLLIEKRPENIGGECLNTGCVPSKALLHVAKLRHDAEKLRPFGVTASGSLDFARVHSYVRKVQESIREHETPEALKTLGLDVAFGTARFVSPDTVQVGEAVHRARRIVLAIGSRPSIPRIPGLEQQVPYLTNESLFELRSLPKKLLILGAGPIGVEMSQAFTRLGSEVTVVEQSSRLLSRDPVEASDLLRAQLEQEGVRFRFRSRISEFPSAGIAEIMTENGPVRQEFDEVLIAIGRRVDYGELDLSKAAVGTEDGRIKIDRYLRTTNKRIYVSGDATGQVYLTHATELHGYVILWNLLSPIKKKISYDDLGWVTFTDPEVATFGLSEHEIGKRGISYRKVIRGFEDVNRAATDDYPESKLVLYLKGERILGGTMVAPGAGELIQELILAKQNNISIRKLLQKTYPYPTATRINRWLAIWEYDRKMTEPIKRLLRGAFRVMG